MGREANKSIPPPTNFSIVILPHLYKVNPNILADSAIAITMLAASAGFQLAALFI